MDSLALKIQSKISFPLIDHFWIKKLIKKILIQCSEIFNVFQPSVSIKVRRRAQSAPKRSLQLVYIVIQTILDNYEIHEKIRVVTNFPKVLKPFLDKFTSNQILICVLCIFTAQRAHKNTKHRGVKGTISQYSSHL